MIHSASIMKLLILTTVVLVLCLITVSVNAQGYPGYYPGYPGGYPGYNGHGHNNNWNNNRMIYTCTYPSYYQPVCGNDRVTYQNVQAFYCAQRQSYGLSWYSSGRCRH